MAAPPNEAVHTLVTFDVDGTLLRSVGADANKLHKAAFAKALESVCGLANGDIDQLGRAHHGSTDSLILVAMQEAHGGIPKQAALANLPACFAAMIAEAQANRDQAGTGLEVLPGVKAVLAAMLADPRVVTGLVTGNVPEIAWTKMAAVGLGDMFSSNPRLGGFGTEYCSGDTSEEGKAADRAQLVLLARRKALRVYPTIVRHVHVGDAPADVRAGEAADGEPGPAQAVEAFSIGVTTGLFGRPELEAVAKSPKTVVMEGLTDTAACLRSCGLGDAGPR